MVCLLGQKLGDNVVSLSQLNAVSTLFLMGKIFHETFFSPKPRGVFCNILVALVVVPSQASLVPSPLCSLGLPGAPFDSIGYTLYCVLENVRVGVGVQGGCSPSPPAPPDLFGESGWKQVFAESLAEIWPERARPTRAFFDTY